MTPHNPGPTSSCTFSRRVSVPILLGASCWPRKAIGSLVARGFWGLFVSCSIRGLVCGQFPICSAWALPQTNNISKSVGVKMRGLDMAGERQRHGNGERKTLLKCLLCSKVLSFLLMVSGLQLKLFFGWLLHFTLCPMVAP